MWEVLLVSDPCCGQMECLWEVLSVSDPCCGQMECLWAVHADYYVPSILFHY